MHACQVLRNVGYRPYNLIVIEERLVECISYPFPTDDNTGVGIMIREKGDPTTMREHVFPVETVKKAMVL